MKIQKWAAERGIMERGWKQRWNEPVCDIENDNASNRLTKSSHYTLWSTFKWINLRKWIYMWNFIKIYNIIKKENCRGITYPTTVSLVSLIHSINSGLIVLETLTERFQCTNLTSEMNKTIECRYS